MSSLRTTAPIWLPALLASGVAFAVPQGGINPAQARPSNSALSAIRLHDPASDPKPAPVDDLALPAEDPLLVKDAESNPVSTSPDAVAAAPASAPVVVSADNIAHEKWSEIALPATASSAGQTAAITAAPAIAPVEQAAQTPAATTDQASAEMPKTAAAVPPQTWTLNADDPIHVQLQDWAKQSGWRLEWKLKRSWVTPAPAKFTGTFDQAVDQVITGLYAEGKPVHLALWAGNKYAEVTNVDIR